MKAYDIIDNKKLLTLLFYINNGLFDSLEKKIVFLISKKYDFINLKNIPYWDPSLNILLDNLEAYISKLEELIDNDSIYATFQDEALRVFDMIDINCDGVLTVSEIKTALKQNLEIQKLLDLPARLQGPNFLENETKFTKTISMMDTDGDHEISREEFIEMYPTLKENMEKRKKEALHVFDLILQGPNFLENETEFTKTISMMDTDEEKLEHHHHDKKPTGENMVIAGGEIGKHGNEKELIESNKRLDTSFDSVHYLIEAINIIINTIKENLMSIKVLKLLSEDFKKTDQHGVPFNMISYSQNYKKFEMRSDVVEKIESLSREFYTKKIVIVRYLPIEDGCANMEEDNG